MSVAFRRESDEEHLEPRFELPIPPGPNYVTPRGRALLAAQVAELKARIAAAADEAVLTDLRRSLRYWHTRLATAVPAPVPAAGEVGIGSTVSFRLNGAARTLTVVGGDEADPHAGRLAFSAPLARALMGATAGEHVDFAGQADAIEVLSVETTP